MYIKEKVGACSILIKREERLVRFTFAECGISFVFTIIRTLLDYGAFVGGNWNSIGDARECFFDILSQNTISTPTYRYYVLTPFLPSYVRPRMSVQFSERPCAADTFNLDKLSVSGAAIATNIRKTGGGGSTSPLQATKDAKYIWRRRFFTSTHRRRPLNGKLSEKTAARIKSFIFELLDADFPRRLVNKLDGTLTV